MSLSNPVDVIEGYENDAIFTLLKNIEDWTEASIRNTFYDVGAKMKRRANEEILRGGKKGRLYTFRSRSGVGRRYHRASAPGETHANFSGNLRKSLDFNVSGDNELEFGYGVGNRPAPIYAEWVEDGTNKMEPRPTIQNAVDDVQADFEVKFEENMYSRYH
jgi:HK97 gp10 family phage protein